MSFNSRSVYTETHATQNEQRWAVGCGPEHAILSLTLPEKVQVEHLKSTDVGRFKTLFVFPLQALDTQSWAASKGPNARTETLDCEAPFVLLSVCGTAVLSTQL